MLRIPEDILEAAGVAEQECLIELAVHLYAERRLAFAHALRLAGLNRLEFEKELSSDRSATTRKAGAEPSTWPPLACPRAP